MEPHVLDPGNILRPLKVLASAVLSSLTRVVHEVFGHLSKRTTLFPEVDDYAAAALLGLLDCLFHAEDEVWPARADIRAEDIAAVALVVDTEGKAHVRIRHLGRVAEDVDGQTADGWEEELNVMAGNQLRV